MARLLRQNPDLVSLAEHGTLRPENLDLSGLAGTVAWVWAGLGAVVLVQVILLAFRGQNIGKLLFGIRVVRVDNGEPAGFVRAALLRFLLPLLVMFVLNLIMLLGFLLLFVDLCCMFRRDRRCLHDLIAGTKVVKA